jgi:hypothetical protein
MKDYKAVVDVRTYLLSGIVDLKYFRRKRIAQIDDPLSRLQLGLVDDLLRIVMSRGLDFYLVILSSLILCSSCA